MSFRWLLQVYTRDVWSRLPQLRATATSVYGKILKIDSTNKVCKKPAGAAARTVTWVTNVGNERGEVLISVVTDSEGLLALKPMADGLMRRRVGLVTTNHHYTNYILDTALQVRKCQLSYRQIEIAATSVGPLSFWSY